MSSFLLFQVCCSVLAGVYNEYIIKNVAGTNVDIMLQNAYMYLTSIFCNFLFIVTQQNLVLSANNEEHITSSSHEEVSSFFHGLDNSIVTAIIVCNASIGIMTSLFIKTFNSVLKTFVSALELVLTAILSFLIFGIPIYWNTSVSVLVVSGAIMMYVTNPIISNAVKEEKCDKPLINPNNSKIHE